MKNVYKIICVLVILLIILFTWAYKKYNPKDNMLDGPGMVNYAGYLDFDVSSFDSMLNQGKPIIIDFGADWCGPCQKFHPILEQVSFAHSEDAFIKYVDVDKEENFAKQYPVQAIPTQVFIMPDGSNYEPSRNINITGLEIVKQQNTGKEVTYHIGALNEEEFEIILKDMKR